MDIKQFEILTPKQLAERLHVSVGWIKERSRPGKSNPIPRLYYSGQLRFEWSQVVEWVLSQEPKSEPAPTVE